jgi:hypothetical protein
MRAGDVHRVPDAVDCEERADALVPPLARLAVHLIQADAAGGGVGNQLVPRGRREGGRRGTRGRARPGRCCRAGEARRVA